MVAEHSEPEIAVMTQSDRTEFIRARVLPAGMSIWLGRIDCEKWHTAYFRHSATMTLAGTIPPKGTVRNVHVATFGVSRLFVFVLVNRSNVDGFGLHDSSRAVSRLCATCRSSTQTDLRDTSMRF